MEQPSKYTICPHCKEGYEANCFSQKLRHMNCQPLEKMAGSCHPYPGMKISGFLLPGSLQEIQVLQLIPYTQTLVFKYQ